MKLSQYFLPTLKENPKESQIISHQLMLRAGMVMQTAAGIYSWLPLGAKVLKNIENIIRDEQNKIGSQEVILPTIQPAELWHKSGRYDDYGKEMLRIKDRHDRDMLYGPTAEEVITDIADKHLKSYKQLPLTMYQIHWKFRDEIRPRFGVMRGREFHMKDAYSFDIDYESAKKSYERQFMCYMNTFRRMGLTAVPVKADTGPIGGNLSHEFHVLAKTGESEIFYDSKLDEMIASDSFDVHDVINMYAAADEMHSEEECPINTENLSRARGIEIGHIFYLGTKYSEAMGVQVTGKDGESVNPHMGCYGIGVSRLVGAIIEANHDDNGIIWPDSVAPFKVGIINLKPKDKECSDACEKLYEELNGRLNIETIYDDRDERAGAKFADMDLIGVPVQIIIGPRSVSNNMYEVKDRRTCEKNEFSYDVLLDKLRDRFIGDVIL